MPTQEFSTQIEKEIKEAMDTSTRTVSSNGETMTQTESSGIEKIKKEANNANIDSNVKFIPNDISSPSSSIPSKQSKGSHIKRPFLSQTRTSVEDNFKNPSIDEEFEAKLGSISSIPTYYITEKQFEDPMALVESLQSIGEKYGAIKVIPPAKKWNPGFHLDLDRLKFRAVVQTLNNSTSNYDERIQFYRELLEFHKTKKLPLLRLPSIDKRVLDLFKLRKSVKMKGGFDLVCSKKLWAQIGRELGYTGRIMTSLSSSLKSSYQRVVYDFDLYEKSSELEPSENPNESNKRPLERIDDTVNGALKKPKLEKMTNNDTLVSIPTVSNSRHVYRRPKDILKAKGFKTNFESYTEEKLGISQVDDNTFPYYDFNYWHRGAEVLDVPFPSNEVTQLYTIDEFFDIHLKFCEKLFQNNEVDDKTLISNYWTLISSKSPDFRVETAVDLPKSIHGSGFSTAKDLKHLNKQELLSPWNLNNIPLDENGLFRYFKSDHEGISRPSLNLSMLYSTFSWSCEDFYLNAIDYHHTGDSKIWYFVSPKHKTQFEDILKAKIRESKSDRISQIRGIFPSTVGDDVLESIAIDEPVFQRAGSLNPYFNKFYDHEPSDNTIRYNSDVFIPPEYLKAQGIDVYYTIQKPGQFIIKFPRLYSSTVSLGFSITERVNFATLSWIDHAIEAEKWIQKQGLLPNFSFFEFLTIILEDCKEPNMLKKIAPYYNLLMKDELEVRSNVKATVTQIKQVQNKFDYITDDILASSFPSKVVVLVGQDNFSFQPSNFLTLWENKAFADRKDQDLRFELHIYHSDDRLKAFQRTLVTYSQSPSDWLEKFEEIMSTNPKPPIRSLRALLSESEKILQKIPEAQILKVYLDDANSWIEKAQEVLNAKQKIRIRNKRGIKKDNEQPEEHELYSPKFIENLIKEIDGFNFTCLELDQLIEFATEIYQFEITVRTFLSDKDHSLDEFYDMIDLGKSFGVDLRSVKFLERLVNRLEWIKTSEEHLKNPSTSLDDYQVSLKEGYEYGSSKDQELIGKIQHKVEKGKFLVEKIKYHLSSNIAVLDVDILIERCKDVPMDLDVLQKLHEIRDQRSKAKEACNEIYSQVSSNQAKLTDLREQRKMLFLQSEGFNQELYDKLLENFIGDENDIRPKYSAAKVILDQSRELMPSSPSAPLDNYLRQVEDWLRRTKKLFGKTNAPFSVLRSHLQTILDTGEHCFSTDDKYVKDLKEEDHKIYCFCRRPESGTMIECERCSEWYHCKCLRLGRMKSKSFDDFVCPICDYRIEIPKEYNSPRLEQLRNIVEEGSFLELLPDELDLIRRIYENAVSFKAFLVQELRWDENGALMADDTKKLKFYLRKLSGAGVLLLKEYNQLRQMVYMLDPICDTPPPMVENSEKTKKKRRPTTQDVNASVLSVTAPPTPTPVPIPTAAPMPASEPVPVPAVPAAAVVPAAAAAVPVPTAESKLTLMTSSTFDSQNKSPTAGKTEQVPQTELGPSTDTTAHTADTSGTFTTPKDLETLNEAQAAKDTIPYASPNGAKTD